MTRSNPSLILQPLFVLLLLVVNSTAHSHSHERCGNNGCYNHRMAGSDLPAVPGKTGSVLNLHSKDAGTLFQLKLQSSAPLSIRGGSISDAKASNEIATPSSSSQSQSPTVKIFLTSSFLIVSSVAVVAFSPAPALIAKIGTERATSTLSLVSASAALTEIILSPAIGSILDVVGRKPALLLTLSAIAMANGAVAINPSVLAICTAKFVGMLSVGLFFIASQAIIGDIAAENPELMSSTLGVQYALIGAAFFVGAIAAGKLSEFGLGATYGTSSVVAIVTAGLVSLGMRETLSPANRVPFQGKNMRRLLLQSPFSCTRIIFRYSKEVRVLAIILMLQSFPQFMGDVFQILAKTEWNLETKDFSSFVAMFGMINIVANIVGSQLVKKLGIKQFTTLAILSSMLSPMGAAFFSFRGLIAGSIAGFLGASQMLGVNAALIAEGAKSDVPQGQLAGERSSFICLIKVIGPIWYNMLYVRGKKALGLNNLPFLFNIVLAMGAFVISQFYLS
eukprot:CAMPEP_0172312284 /NCGR_PEP_ID=MMETSP1058-20130122/17103_1 /TAXON_ID=83371 /ORGANISM="Detonula confervacea, Strain CCMP 353" /LENGTH=505 /DNA_ID=CAMNT_0013025695 /DNA_START=169 /DNA_END=1686 /DNA_ORIENTATION=-